MANTAEYVYYNDGTDTDVYALVIGKDPADNNTVDLWTAVGEVKGVPRREPSDYGPEGGGRTWHESPSS